jgi:citronellol/citronellal dehydrogenase
MADAAYIILTKPSRELTGQFLVDDDVLRETGVTDLSRYRRPGVEEDELRPDLFV